MSIYQKAKFLNLNNQNILQSTKIIDSLFCQNKYYQQSQLSESQQSLQQVKNYDFDESLNENIYIVFPKLPTNLSLITSLNVQKQVALNMIDEKKKKYLEISKKKQINKLNFISTLEKNRQNQTKTNRYQSASKQYIQSEHNNNLLTAKQSKKQNFQSQLDSKNIIRKIIRSQTQSNKKDTITNNQFVMKSQKSSKKKVKLRRSSVFIQDSTQKSYNNKNQLGNKNEIHQFSSKKGESQMSMSKNQFLFLQQYQKDQKQIMNRLLNIIQKQQILSTQHSILQKSTKNNKKPQQTLSVFNSLPQNPIIINNYIKSPTQTIDKKLIEKEIQIKLLEQNRNRKKTQFRNVITEKLLCNSRLNNTQNGLRKQINTNLNTIKKDSYQNIFNAHINQSTHKSGKSTSLNCEQQANFQQLFQSIKKQNQQLINEQTKRNQKQTKQLATQQKLQNKQISVQKFDLNLSTINKIPFTQSLNQATQQKSIKQMNNFFQNEQINEFKNQGNTFRTQINASLNQFKRKQNVLMEISFGQNQSNQLRSISLADAFKKKFGNNPSISKRKDISQNKQTNTKKPSIQQHQLDNKKNKNTQSRTKLKVIKVKKSKQNIKNKQNNETYQSQLNLTQRSQKRMTKKQPSQQLLNRLIYGTRAAISKKQMYQLTKKNYSKLPEIQQKRKASQKQLKQALRLEKTKQYQKQIRASTHSRSKAQQISH